MLNHHLSSDRHTTPMFSKKTTLGVLETTFDLKAMVQSPRTFASSAPVVQPAVAMRINTENGYPNNMRKMETCSTPKMTAVAFELCLSATSPLHLVMSDVISAPHRLRQHSQVSECLSDDSYILFEAASTEDDCFSDLGSSEDEEDDTEMLLKSKEKDDLEFSDDQHYDFGVEPKKGWKRVHFSHDAPTVHEIIAWSFAYRACRKGPWEEYVRDRDRFQRRIAACEQTLSAVFDQTHRNQVFRERFQENNEFEEKSKSKRRRTKRRGRKHQGRRRCRRKSHKKK